jgi:hypothetical protein
MTTRGYLLISVRVSARFWRGFDLIVGVMENLALVVGRELNIRGEYY